jgi:hypothetical protein
MRFVLWKVMHRYGALGHYGRQGQARRRTRSEPFMLQKQCNFFNKLMYKDCGVMVVRPEICVKFGRD